MDEDNAKYITPYERTAGKLRLALLREQHNMLRHILPPLYATMIATMIAFAFVFNSALPEWFSFQVPMVFLLFLSASLIYWLVSLVKGPEGDPEKIQRDLNNVSIVTPVIIAAYSTLVMVSQWQAQSQQMTIAIMVVWSISLITSFSLSTLPFSSIMVVLGATLPISISFTLNGDPALAPLGGVFVAQALLVIYTNQVTHRSFVESIVARWKLKKKNGIIKDKHEYATEIAYTDLLTKLPNRRSFYDLLDKNVQLFQQGKIKPFAVAILDLDGFKPVNDMHGHAIGDEVLIDVGKRLSTAIGTDGIIARLGGDEFAVVIHDISSPTQAIHFGDLLCNSLLPAFRVGTVTAQLSGSCGFYIVNEGGTKPSHILERADIALYKAKSASRGSSEIFSKEMAELVSQNSRTEEALREAIADNSIDVQYQPIVDLKTKNVIGMEALARWHHPVLGSVSPSHFIPIAEHIGLIAELTENLFQKAMQAARDWPDDIFLSFNLSADHLTNPSVGLNILSVVLRNEFSPKRLEIEVTEAAIMKDQRRARTTLTNLKQAGVKLALDDFGAGYSSLNQIKDLPFDKIKVDKNFTDEICDSERTRQLVLSVIDMCKNLNIDCVIEGIENEKQRDLLLKMGCNQGQGYLFAKSMSSEETAALFQTDGLHHSA